MPPQSLSWSRTFRVWWSIAFQSLLNTVFFWIVIGVPLGLLATITGVFSAEAAQAIGLVTTPVIFFASTLWGVRLALKKEYADFRLEVVDLVDPRLL
jgi:hypothetical protein